MLLSSKPAQNWCKKLVCLIWILAIIHWIRWRSGISGITSHFKSLHCQPAINVARSRLMFSDSVNPAAYQMQQGRTEWIGAALILLGGNSLDGKAAPTRLTTDRRRRANHGQQEATTQTKAAEGHPPQGREYHLAPSRG